MSIVADTLAALAASIPAPPTREQILADPQGREKAQLRGTHRSRSLADTLRLAWLCRAQAGISRLADITDLDEVGIPVVSTYRPTAAPRNLTVTSGKGLSLLAATVSGLMEAIERYCGEVQGRRGIEGSFRELLSQGAHPVHPARLILRRGCAWTEDTACEWWPVREVQSDRAVLVPAAAVFVPYLRPPHFFASTSDGLAAGNCLSEAVLHGLYELIERDATAFGETLRSGAVVDPATFPADAQEIATRIGRAGLELRCYALPSVVGVPVFYAVLDDPRRADPMLINGGAGCHLDPSVALCRALTEAVQSRLCVISGSREDLSDVVSRRDHSYNEVRAELAAWEAGWPEASFDEVPNAGTGAITTDLALLVGRLREAGFPHLLVADLTLAGLPFRVCRTIVPGFEFFHQEPDRLGGRLFRALLAAGKLGEAQVDG